MTLITYTLGHCVQLLTILQASKQLLPNLTSTLCTSCQSKKVKLLKKERQLGLTETVKWLQNTACADIKETTLRSSIETVANTKKTFEIKKQERRKYENTR